MIKEWLTDILNLFGSDKRNDEPDVHLFPVKRAFNDSTDSHVVITKEIVYPPSLSKPEPAENTKEEPLLQKEFQKKTVIPYPEAQISPTLAEKNKAEPQSEPRSALEIIAEFFAKNPVSKKATKTLERAIDGNDQAKKDLWYFIHNKKEGAPDNKELWKAGFDLLKEAAANGNKQAISDLAYVKYHGIGGVKQDQKEAFADMENLGYKTTDDALNHWHPGKDVTAVKPILTISSTLSDYVFSTSGNGKIISNDLKNALLAKGVNPDKCEVEYVNNTGTKNPGYIVTVHP